MRKLLLATMTVATIAAMPVTAQAACIASGQVVHIYHTNSINIRIYLRPTSTHNGTVYVKTTDDNYANFAMGAMNGGNRVHLLTNAFNCVAPASGSLDAGDILSFQTE